MFIATILLIIAIVGLTSLIAFKAWELRSETVMFSPVRIKVGGYSHRLLENLRAEFPRTAARATRIFGRILRAYASFGLAKALIAFESFLEKTLRLVRTAPRQIERRGEASPFLREVAAYKRMIARSERKEAALEGEVIPTPSLPAAESKESSD